MEGKHDIVVSIFKTKNLIVNKERFIPRPAAKLLDKFLVSNIVELLCVTAMVDIVIDYILRQSLGHV